MQELLLDPSLGSPKEIDVSGLGKKAARLNRQVRDWAEKALTLLPLANLSQNEICLLKVYLAKQHRVNLQLDAQRKQPLNFVTSSMTRLAITNPRAFEGVHYLIERSLS